MRKVFKYLAVILALTMLIGVIPAQAATSVSLKKKSGTLFIDGCTGKKADGSKAKFYSYMNVAKKLNGYNADTMKIKLETEDKTIASVNNKKARIKAKGLGKTVVRVTVTDQKSNKVLMSKSITITVKKNATAASFSCEGIVDGRTINVGDSITVKIPKGTDTDKRRLVASDPSVKISNSGTTYKAEFTQAGTFTLSAEAYQSDSYSGASFSKSCTVVVKAEEGEATPTPTPTPEPTKVPTAATVNQTALNAVELTLADTASGISSSNVKVYYKVTGIEIPYSTIKEVKVNGNKVNVSVYTNFKAGQEYFVSCGEKEYSFTALDVKKEDIDRITITTTQAKVNTPTDLGIKYYIGEIDVTDEFGSSIIPEITVTPNDVAFPMGNQIYFAESGKTAIVKIKALVGNKAVTYEPIYVEGAGQVSSFAPSNQRMIYTITTDDGIYMKQNDAVSTSLTLDDSDAVFEALFLYSDGTAKTMAEEGITRIESEDQRVCMIGAPAASGGYKLIPNTVGKTVIHCMSGDKIVQSVVVDVKDARTPSNLTVTLNKSTLNVHSASDCITVTASVYDQYGAQMKGQNITITQNDATKRAFGQANFRTFNADGILLVYGSDVILNSGVANGTISATVECKGMKREISFTVADASAPVAWRLGCTKADTTIRLDNGVLPGNDKPDTVGFYVEGFNNNVHVTYEPIKQIYTEAPLMQYKADKYGLAVGEKAYFMTIVKDGKFITGGDGITVGTDSVEFKEFGDGKKLAAGQYVVTAYLIEGGDPVSKITNLGTRTVIVIDGQIKPVVTQLKDKTTMANPADAAKECFKITVNGVDVTSSIAVDTTPNTGDVNIGNDGTMFFTSVSISFSNTYYGNYTEKIAIGTLIKK